MMEPKIIDAAKRDLVGVCIQTTNAENKTRELWQQFKPKVKTVENLKNSDFYSVQKFQHDFKTEGFTPFTLFEKWAAVEVLDHAMVPMGLDKMTLPAGLYAVFIHVGTPSNFNQTAKYIFEQWLPSSGYELDDRPHFEIMTQDYSPLDPNAQEEVWIPVKTKA